MSEKKIEISVKTILIIGTFILLYQFLVKIEYIIILVIMSYILMAAIDPLVKRMTHRGINRGFSIIVIYLAFVAVATFFGIVVIKPLITETFDLIKQLPKLLANYPLLQSYLPKEIIDFKPTSAPSNLLKDQTSWDALYRALRGFATGATGLLSLIVMSIYMLLDKDYNYKSIANIISPKHSAKTLKIIDKVEKKLGGWVQAQLILSAFIFVCYYIGLNVLHIKFSLTLSILAAFLEVIPVAGPVITAILVGSITFLTNPQLIIYFLVFALIVQQTEAHILVPKIMQRVIGLNPLITIIALLIGTEFFGIIGAILSVPIAAILQILYLEYKKYD